MSKKNIVIFGGSQEVQTSGVMNEISSELKVFLECNKYKIEKVLYGGGTYGVMGIILTVCREVGVIVKGYSIERYREYDEGNGVDIDFFVDDDTRLKQFSSEGDIFLSLPGGKGTIKETLSVSDLILESGEDKSLYVPLINTALFNLLSDLGKEGMLHPDDNKVINTVDDIGKIRI